MGKYGSHHHFSCQKLINSINPQSRFLPVIEDKAGDLLPQRASVPWVGKCMFQVKHPVFWGLQIPNFYPRWRSLQLPPPPETHTLADTEIMAILACHSLQPKPHLCSLGSLHNLTSRSQLHLFSLCSCVSSIDTNFAFNKGWVPMNSVLYYQLVLIRD